MRRHGGFCAGDAGVVTDMMGGDAYVSLSKPSINICVDLKNPGQVIACCGLLELAHRLWPGVEGWYDEASFMFASPDQGVGLDLAELMRRLATCGLSTLTAEECTEREDLERQRRQLKKQGGQPTAPEEQRLKELGKRARAGSLRVGEPFDLLIDWFEADEGAVTPRTPKTWAGQQELRKVARAAQDALSRIGDLAVMLEYSCVLRTPVEYHKGGRGNRKKVEPFYFDARRFVHALDDGFSPDKQKMEVSAHPVVELLCLIGLQRFRPIVVSEERRLFGYWTWPTPLNAPVAAAVFCGAVPLPGRQGYRFRLRFRDDQRRYKAFGFATPVGGDT